MGILVGTVAKFICIEIKKTLACLVVKEEPRGSVHNGAVHHYLHLSAQRLEHSYTKLKGLSRENKVVFGYKYSNRKLFSWAGVTHHKILILLKR